MNIIYCNIRVDLLTWLDSTGILSKSFTEELHRRHNIMSANSLKYSELSEDLCLLYFINALYEIGIYMVENQVIELDKIITQYGINKNLKPYLRLLFKDLSREGYCEVSPILLTNAIQHSLYVIRCLYGFRW